MSIDIFEEMEKNDTEQVIFNYNKETGLKSIMAINNTKLGPAVGGCRIRDYETTEEALKDVLRLAEGMTYKTALSGARHGGGKIVVIGDPKKDKNDMLLRDIGRFIEILKGRYYVGPDVGTTSYDMAEISNETDYVLSLPEEYGGYGDPSRPTAYGVFMAMKAAVKFEYGKDSLKDMTVAVQGVGKVGKNLVEYLVEEGAKVIISSKTEESSRAITSKFPGVEVVEADEIYQVDCDIFAPCALGGSLNKETIKKLKCKIVAGSANNQLAGPESAQELYDRGIIFAPDFVINSGGFISASDPVDMGDVNVDRVMNRTEKIYELTYQVLEMSKKEGIEPNEIAKRLAEEKIEIIGNIKNKFIKD